MIRFLELSCSSSLCAYSVLKIWTLKPTGRETQTLMKKKKRIGGDFNACIGLIDGDDLALLQHVGPIGMGQRNATGTMLKFYIFNRDGSLQRDENWTCRRAYDGTCVQLDFIMGDAYFTLKKAWQNYCIPIGNDHRCVHCILSRRQPYKQQYPSKQVLKVWKLIMDESGKPSTFHTWK